MALTLRALREDAGLTQAEVADRMGVSQQAVGKWERSNDPGDSWLRLAQVLDVHEPYPAAPFEPEGRNEWFVRRNRHIQSVKLRGAYGTGQAPKEA